MSEYFVETLERFDRGSGLEDSPIFPNLSVAGEGTDSPISLQRGTSVIGIENKIAQTRKEMHWKNMGAQGAGNKLANYLLGLGMNVFTLRDYYVPGRGLTGLFKVMETAQDPFLQIDPAYTPKVIDLDTDTAEFPAYLRDNWHLMPEFVSNLQTEIARIRDFDVDASGVKDFQTSDAGVSATLGEEIQTKLSNLNINLGDLGRNKTMEFGVTLENEILTTAYAKVASSFKEELRERSRVVVTHPRVDEQNKLVFDGTGTPVQMHSVFSYDGTPYGEVESVFDLFSGGTFMPADSNEFLQNLAHEDIDMFENLQQELWAMGFMKDAQGGHVQPQWGVVDDTTFKAFNDLTFNILEENVRTGGQFDADVLRNRVVTANLDKAKDSAAFASDLELRFKSSLSTKAQEIITDLGREISADGKVQLNTAIQNMISDLSPEDEERLWGEGISGWEKQVADAILTEFYETENWGSEVTFGPHDNEESYFLYALDVGAITPEHFEAFQVPKGARRIVRGTESPELAAEREDVARAVLLSRINMNDETSFDRKSIEEALRYFAQTMGRKQQIDGNRQNRDWGQVASNIHAKMPILLGEVDDPSEEFAEELVKEELGYTRKPSDAILEAIGGRTRGVPVRRSVTRNV